MRKITQTDAIKIKAVKVAAYFHVHNKNLTKYQEQIIEELYDVLTAWNYVKDNLKEYNLED